MAVAKRQGREKPEKIEQRQVKGRSEDRSKDLRKNKQHSWLSPICIGQARGEEKNIKGGAKAFSLSLSLSLSLPPCLYPVLWHAPPLSSRLWVGMPSHFEDGFSCYLLNKIEL